MKQCFYCRTRVFALLKFVSIWKFCLTYGFSFGEFRSQPCSFVPAASPVGKMIILCAVICQLLYV